MPSLEDPAEQSTDLENASTLLGRLPRVSVLDSTESTVPGLWRTGQRRVTPGLWARTHNSKPQVVSEARLP